MLFAAERPLLISGGGVINAEASAHLVRLAELTNTPVIPTLMGWGTIPDDHPLNAGMMGLQTQTRYGNATFLSERLRARHREPVGESANRQSRRFIPKVAPSCTSISSRPKSGRVFQSRISVSSSDAARSARKRSWRKSAQRAEVALRLPDRTPIGRREVRRSVSARCCARPISTTCRSNRSGCFAEINAAFDDDTQFVTAIGLYQIASGQFQRKSTNRATT